MRLLLAILLLASSSLGVQAGETKNDFSPTNQELMLKVAQLEYVVARLESRINDLESGKRQNVAMHPSAVPLKAVPPMNSPAEIDIPSSSLGFSAGAFSSPSVSPYIDSKGRTIHTGPRGGQYYINKNGNKTYIRR